MSVPTTSGLRGPFLALGLGTALAVGGALVPAAAPLQPLVKLEMVGQVGGPTYGVAVDGDYAYVGIGPRLAILDLSTPGAPSVIGQGEVLPDLVRGVAVVGPNAYVTYGDEFPTPRRNGGLRIYDVSNPRSPRQVGAFVTPGNAYAVIVMGGNAYLADGRRGVQVVDVRDPAAPSGVSLFATSDRALDVAAAGSHVYVAVGSTGLQILDASNPLQLRQVGAFDTPGDARDVTVAGGYAFVADGSSGLQIINVTDPTTPGHAGSLAVPASTAAQGIAVSGSVAYFGYGRRLNAIDVSTPAAPRAIGALELDDLTEHLVVVGTTAYVAAAQAGPLVVDVSRPDQLRLVGVVRTPAVVDDVVARGGYAYLASGEGGLHVVDVTDRTEPNAVGWLDTPGIASAVTIAGDHVYLGDRINYLADGTRLPSSLRVVDISSPTAPREVGVAELPGNARDVAVSGDYAYVADERTGLLVIDVSDPTSPHEVGSLSFDGRPVAVAVAEGYAFVAADEQGMRVVDVGDPTAPREVASASSPGPAVDIAVAQDYAYVLYDAWRDGMLVFDVFDPTRPVPEGTIGEFMWPAQRLTVAGYYVYVAGHEAGVWAFDVEDPSEPLLAGSFDTVGYARAVAPVGQYVFVADGDGGLVALRVEVLPTPAPTRTATATPETPTPTPTIFFGWKIHLPATFNGH